MVFRGSQLLCREYSLVLEARGIEHETQQDESSWVLSVPAEMRHRAYDELNRYSVERGVRRSVPEVVPPHSGALIGVFLYVLILLLTAYCAGNATFGADWLSLGSLDAGARGEWWRAVTALTLHLDQEHLLGNVLFGAVAGAAASRLLGPGVAWASILGAATLANYAEILITPITHRAVGASTAVFAALGLLSGMAWRQRLTLRERLWYRWAPLIAGMCLLTLLGAGSAHVDVLGHALVSFRTGRWLDPYSNRRSQRSGSARTGHRGSRRCAARVRSLGFCAWGQTVIQGAGVSYRHY